MNNAGFWSMGGYAGFVWPCFGLTLAVLGWNVWSARRLLTAARLRTSRAAAMAASDAAAAGAGR